MKWKQEELDFGSLKGEQKDLAIEAGSRAEEEPDTRDGVRAEEGSDTKDEIREEENAQPSEENEPVGEHEDSRAETAVSEGEIVFQLNGAPLRLPQKEDGRPYYLMDMIQYSGIDLKNPKGRIELTVNGVSGFFQQELKAGDNICIQEE